MQNEHLDEYVLPECPIRHVLSRISSKWTLLVLYTLNTHSHTMRFGELRRAIPDVSQKMLTNTLRTLEEDGLISRKVYAEVPPRVEYSLTERGLSLIPYMDALIRWAKDNMADIMNERKLHRTIG